MQVGHARRLGHVLQRGHARAAETDLAQHLADLVAKRVVEALGDAQKTFVEAHPGRLGGTITPHHLSYNRNAIFKGGIRPHFYCLPIAKREEHRLALRRAATSGNPAFFLGTDTAPHTADTKECACGCAGIFNAPVAMQVYAQVFMEENALDKLEAFASLNGPRFYGLPANEERITLLAKPLDAPEQIEVPGGNKSIVVFRPDTPVGWSF